MIIITFFTKTYKEKLTLSDAIEIVILNFQLIGIATKKQDQRQETEGAEQKAISDHTDVATILARRVAVEMSESEGGNPSDLELNSDDWGDE